MKKKILICITGGSGSGKSTVSKSVFDLIPKNISKRIICMDSYYKSDSSLSFGERSKMNYDHPHSFDFELLKKDLDNLMNDIAVPLMSYNYQQHIREVSTELIEPTDVIILEGIMSCWDPEITSMSSLNIYVDTPPDEQFIRRLERDIKERQRTVENVIHQWRTSVKPMYRRFIVPQKESVHIVVPWFHMNDTVLHSISGAIQELLKRK